MPDIKVTGGVKVKTLKNNIKRAYGCTLRVYSGNSNVFASDEATLASIRIKGLKSKGEFTVNGNMLVGNFENKMKEEFGIKVQIASPNNRYLVDNGITLSAAGRL